MKIVKHSFGATPCISDSNPVQAAGEPQAAGPGSPGRMGVHVREAVAGGTGFLWEINGTGGTLRIMADEAQPQIYP